jgi:hypothetical protein
MLLLHLIVILVVVKDIFVYLLMACFDALLYLIKIGGASFCLSGLNIFSRRVTFAHINIISYLPTVLKYRNRKYRIKTATIFREDCLSLVGFLYLINSEMLMTLGV